MIRSTAGAGLMMISVVAIASSAFGEQRGGRSREQCRQMADARAFTAVDARQIAARARFMKRCMAGKGLKNIRR